MRHVWTSLSRTIKKHRSPFLIRPERAMFDNHWISLVIMLQLLSLHHWCGHPPCIMFHDEDCIHKWWGYMMWSCSLSWYIHPSYYDIIDHCQPSLSTTTVSIIINHSQSSIFITLGVQDRWWDSHAPHGTQVPLMNFMDQLRCTGGSRLGHSDGT